MTGFRIEFRDIAQGNYELLQSFPEYSINPLDVRTGATLLIYFNDVLMPPEAKKRGWNVTDGSIYPLNFLRDLLSEVKSFDENLHEVSLMYGSKSIYFKRSDRLIELSFGSPQPEEEAKTKLPYLDFLAEVFRCSGEFINKLLEINPKLAEHKDVANIIKERERVKRLYERLKNQTLD